MQSYKRLINESFFNPLLHFIPLLLFLLLNDNFGSNVALIVVYFVVVGILLYSYIQYTNIYKYLGVSYLVSTLIIAIIIFYPNQLISSGFKPIFSELVTLLSFLVILILRKKITKYVSEVTPRHLAMTNNIDEHFRIVWLLSAILFVYTHIYAVSSIVLKADTGFLEFLSNIYWGILIFIISYEFIRVTLIRIRLFKEEWWPIVNENGQVIGSIQSQESISGNEKYIHPVVRGILINDSRIFLQKRGQKNPTDPFLWDVALSNHIRINETVEQCINRSALENYGIDEIKPVLLSKYVHESGNEKQFVYLFLICNLKIVDINPELIDSVKWWTIPQIEENMRSGIFTESFTKEFETLNRSGLLENGTYNCTCRLKEAVFQGITKKD